MFLNLSFDAIDAQNVDESIVETVMPLVLLFLIYISFEKF